MSAVKDGGKWLDPIEIQAILNIAEQDAIVTPGHPDAPTQLILSKVHNLLAFIFWIKSRSEEDEESRDSVDFHSQSLTEKVIDDMLAAAKYAGLAVSEGLLSSVTCDVLFGLRSLAFNFGISLNEYEFWRKIEPTLNQQEQNLIRRDLFDTEHQLAQPACALPGCPSLSHAWERGKCRDLGQPLIPCIFRCSPACKPTYCSDACMQTVRFILVLTITPGSDRDLT